jgi:hypothetical protein
VFGMKYLTPEDYDDFRTRLKSVSGGKDEGRGAESKEKRGKRGGKRGMGERRGRGARGKGRDEGRGEG